MSDRITLSVPPQSQPEQAPVSPEAAIPAQAAAVAESTARSEDAARSEADATLKAAVREYRRGEREHRAALLETGRLADLYLHQRMCLKDKRSAAVQALEGELARWSSAPVDISRMIACYHAFHLLAEEQGLVGTGKKPGPAHDVPYGHYKDAWCQLVERQQKDGPEECWVLLPGLEQEARELFATAVADGLSKPAVQDGVKALLRRYADQQAEQARKAKALAEQEAQQKAAEQVKAQQQAIAAEKAVQQAKAAAEQAGADDKARLTEQARKAEEELRAKQQEAIRVQQEAEKAARDKARAESVAKAAEEAKRRAEERALKASERKHQQGQSKARNLLPADKTDAAELAAMVAEAVTDCDCPDDVFHALLLRLKQSGELSKQSHRAIDAALLILARKPESKPEHSTAIAAA